MLNKIKKYIPLLLIVSALILAGCSSDNGNETAGNKTYYCPMHPEVVSDEPGVCPICHMDLVLKSDDNAMEEHLEEGLTVSGRKQVLANISTVPVTKQNISKTISAFSYLDFAEPNKKLITARFNGRIEKLYVDKTGSYVRKGEPLFDIYSPELVQAQNEYLIAANSFQNTAVITTQGVSRNENQVLNAAKQKLLLFGLTEEQIYELGSTKKVNYSVTYVSPFNGTVIDKKIQDGMYVNEGSVIYDIADLSTLWNIAEVYEADLGVIKNGSEVQLQLDSYPGQIFKGRVNLVYPVVNAETRTVKVRSVFSNSGNQLKPNMYGQAVFSANLGEGLVIPADAILFTGERKIVWVLVNKGNEQTAKTFEQREIITGVKFDGKYQVLSGLEEGELIASSGAYLIDSESQLKKGLSGSGHQHNSEMGAMEGSEMNESAQSSKIWNKVCPVLGGEVEPEVQTVSYNGKTIGFCCPGCDEEFKADPEKFMKNLSANGEKFVGK